MFVQSTGHRFNCLYTSDFRCVIQSAGVFCYTWCRTGIAAVCVCVCFCLCCSAGPLPEFHWALVAFAALSLDILVWCRANHRLKTFSSTNEDARHDRGGEKKNSARQHEPISLIWGPSRTQRASLGGWLARLSDQWLVIDTAWSLSISHSYVIHRPSCASTTHSAHMPLIHSSA